MNNEIQVANGNMPTTSTPQSVFTNSGDNGVQILNQGTINMYPVTGNGSLYNAATKISTDYYNLFVVGNENFTENSFLIGKECALTIDEGVSPEISARFAPLSDEAKAAIKAFPSIFASLNHQYGCTDEAHNAIFGRVTDVEVMENGIKVHIHKACLIPQQRLNEMASNLGILTACGTNEFNRTHWTIKPIDLIDELRQAGFNLPIIV